MKRIIILFSGMLSIPASFAQQWFVFPDSMRIDSAANIWTMYVWENKLYVGGLYYKAGGKIVNGIAAWDGNQWYNLGNGFGGITTPETMCEYKGNLPVLNFGVNYNLRVAGEGRYIRKN